MEKIPFTSYDFYGYLASGGLLIAGIHYLTDISIVADVRSLGLVEIAGLVLAAYIVGHLVAFASAMIIEGWIVGGLFGGLFENLISNQAPKRLSVIVATVFNIRELKRVPGGPQISPEVIPSAFVKGFLKATEDEAHRNRLSNFSNLYGFCRNVCFVFLSLLPLILLSDEIQSSNRITVFCACFVLAIGMFLRYLKFHAAHAKEVYRAYWRLTGESGGV